MQSIEIGILNRPPLTPKQDNTVMVKNTQ